jgi:hypothetical protein
MSHDQLRLERVGLRTKGARRVFLWARSSIHQSKTCVIDLGLGGYSTSTNVHGIWESVC